MFFNKNQMYYFYNNKICHHWFILVEYTSTLSVSYCMYITCVVNNVIYDSTIKHLKITIYNF